MNEQFVTYEIALKLKEKGFDEECIMYYFPNPNKKLGEEFVLVYGKDCIGRDYTPLRDHVKSGLFHNTIAAPLWQQVIDWFRTKNELSLEIYHTSFGYVSMIKEITHQDILPIFEYNDGTEDYNMLREKTVLKAFEFI